MYRWNIQAFMILAMATQASVVQAQGCGEGKPSFGRADNNCAPASAPLAVSFWDNVVSRPAGHVGQLLLPENAGISARTDAWGKTTYYNRHGEATGTSTVDITGNVHYRDRNGAEVERLW